MVDNQINYLLVNSTNEFLVEYNTLEENSRYKLTKFSGSTGEALVTRRQFICLLMAGIIFRQIWKLTMKKLL